MCEPVLNITILMQYSLKAGMSFCYISPLQAACYRLTGWKVYSIFDMKPALPILIVDWHEAVETSKSVTFISFAGCVASKPWDVSGIPIRLCWARQEIAYSWLLNATGVHYESSFGSSWMTLERDFDKIGKGYWNLSMLFAALLMRIGYLHLPKVVQKIFCEFVSLLDLDMLSDTPLAWQGGLRCQQHSCNNLAAGRNKVDIAQCQPNDNWEWELQMLNREFFWTVGPCNNI